MRDHRETAEQVLEAAQITPYLGKHTNVASNGLLLRSDIYTMFDLHLIGIDCGGKVVVSPQVTSDRYQSWRAGRWRSRPL